MSQILVTSISTAISTVLVFVVLRSEKYAASIKDDVETKQSQLEAYIQ